MIVKIDRIKAFGGAVLEIDTERVVRSEWLRSGSGRVSMDDGVVHGLTRGEWLQWEGGFEGPLGKREVAKVEVPERKKVRDEVQEVPEKKAYKSTIREGLLNVRDSYKKAAKK